jgi:hypothetical protein
MISHSRCAFSFLQILKKFSIVVSKSDKKINTLYASTLRDHKNDNINMKFFRNFVAKAMKSLNLLN